MYPIQTQQRHHFSPGTAEGTWKRDRIMSSKKSGRALSYPSARFEATICLEIRHFQAMLKMSFSLNSQPELWQILSQLWQSVYLFGLKGLFD
jgi:hypothetical protein